MGYLVGDEYQPDAARWLQAAREHKGSWWTHWATWLAARSGPRRDAPAALGSEAHPPLMAAPGRYVLQRA
jgi:polyhydroxyalkanoate synthase